MPARYSTLGQVLRASSTIIIHCKPCLRSSLLCNMQNKYNMNPILNRLYASLSIRPRCMSRLCENTMGACREEERFQRLMWKRVNKANSTIDTGRVKERPRKARVQQPSDTIVREVQQLEGMIEPQTHLVLLSTAFLTRA